MVTEIKNPTRQKKKRVVICANAAGKIKAHED